MRRNKLIRVLSSFAPKRLLSPLSCVNSRWSGCLLQSFDVGHFLSLSRMVTLRIRRKCRLIFACAIALMVYFPLSTGRALTPTYRPHCEQSGGMCSENSRMTLQVVIAECANECATEYHPYTA